MTPLKNDLLYVCSLIEFVGRHTKNTNRTIAEKIGKDEVKRQIEVASLNHCLSFEQVGQELIEDFEITSGTFDAVEACDYHVPGVVPIGSVYADLAVDIGRHDTREPHEILYDILTSFISDEISNFNHGAYYENPSYIYQSYLAGELLPI